MRSFALLVVVAALVMSSCVLVAVYYAPDAVAARQTAALARQAQAERLQPFDDAMSIGWRLLPLAFAVGLAGLSLLAFARRLMLVRVGRDVPPLPFDGVARGEYAQLTALGMAAHFEVEKTRAANPSPVLPTGLRSYSPRYVTTAPRVISQPEQKPALVAPAPPVIVPTFGDLLAQGHIGKNRALVLGYTSEGVPVRGDLDSLFSFGIAGLQGSGKTTTERFLLGQVALQGGVFCIVDPHRDVPGGQSLAGTLAPLSGSFLLPPAADDAEVFEVIRLVNSELDRRERGKTGPTLVLAVDEWTDLQRRRCADDLKTLARRVSTTGRKLGVYAAVSGQGWTKEDAGEVRDFLTAAYVHKLRPAVARLLAPGVGNEVWTLAPGQAILDRTNGPRVVVSVPNTRDRDLVAVARQLPAPVGDVAAPARPFRPFTDFAANRPTDSTVADGPGRSNDADAPQTRPESPESTDRPSPTATDRPRMRVLKPQSLVDKARAVGVELSASDWSDLAMIDRGETPQAIAARETGTTEGRPYRRRRDDLMRLAEMIRTWPEDDAGQAADGD